MTLALTQEAKVISPPLTRVARGEKAAEVRKRNVQGPCKRHLEYFPGPSNAAHAISWKDLLHLQYLKLVYFGRFHVEGPRQSNFVGETMFKQQIVTLLKHFDTQSCLTSAGSNSSPRKENRIFKIHYKIYNM